MDKLRTEIFSFPPIFSSIQTRTLHKRIIMRDTEDNPTHFVLLSSISLQKLQILFFEFKDLEKSCAVSFLAFWAEIDSTLKINGEEFL